MAPLLSKLLFALFFSKSKTYITFLLLGNVNKQKIPSRFIARWPRIFSSCAFSFVCFLLKCCGLTNEVNSSENGPKSRLAGLPRRGRPSRKPRPFPLLVRSGESDGAVTSVLGPVLVPTLRRWLSTASAAAGRSREGCVLSRHRDTGMP